MCTNGFKSTGGSQPPIPLTELPERITKIIGNEGIGDLKLLDFITSINPEENVGLVIASTVPSKLYPKRVPKIKRAFRVKPNIYQLDIGQAQESFDQATYVIMRARYAMWKTFLQTELDEGRLFDKHTKIVQQYYSCSRFQKNPDDFCLVIVPHEIPPPPLYVRVDPITHDYVTPPKT